MAMKNAIQGAVKPKDTTGQGAQASVNTMLNSILDAEGMRKRFDEVLGKRSPQFISSIVSMINADDNLREIFISSPMSVIQAALKCAVFDLPVDQNLGYAYIVPFYNSKRRKREATFILGWKGMQQLALRTGAYKVINVIDIREGELKSFNRLTEEIEIDFIEDENEREAKEIIGYVGYYRLVNGAEKTIYMSREKIISHEKKFRKGESMGKQWRENWEDMAIKTVYRKLIGKWGIMSINYQTVDDGKQLAEVISDDEQREGLLIDVDAAEVIEVDCDVKLINEETGEIVNAE